MRELARVPRRPGLASRGHWAVFLCLLRFLSPRYANAAHRASLLTWTASMVIAHGCPCWIGHGTYTRHDTGFPDDSNGKSALAAQPHARSHCPWPQWRCPLPIPHPLYHGLSPPPSARGRPLFAPRRAAALKGFHRHFSMVATRSRSHWTLPTSPPPHGIVSRTRVPRPQVPTPSLEHAAAPPTHAIAPTPPYSP